MRTLSTQMEAAAGPDQGGREAATGAAAVLAPQQAQALAALLEGAVAHKLRTVQVPVGSAGELRTHASALVGWLAAAPNAGGASLCYCAGAQV